MQLKPVLRYHIWGLG